MSTRLPAAEKATLRSLHHADPFRAESSRGG
jgi:hypothetical protein